MIINNLINGKEINVAFLVFNQIEAMDLNGPLDVFIKANYFNCKYNVYTVSEKKEELFSEGETLIIIAKYTFKDAPKADILVLPGASPNALKKNILKDQNILNWIKEQHSQSSITMAICTGALPLSKCGILDNKKATTHYLVFEELRKNKKTAVIENVRFIHDGKIITTAAIVSGIDATLYLIKLINGEEVMNKVCEILHHEYRE